MALHQHCIVHVCWRLSVCIEWNLPLYAIHWTDILNFMAEAERENAQLALRAAVDAISRSQQQEFINL